MDDVENAVVAVGHDTDNKRAEEKVYGSLPSCCSYDREGSAGEANTHSH